MSQQPELFFFFPCAWHVGRFPPVPSNVESHPSPWRWRLARMTSINLRTAPLQGLSPFLLHMSNDHFSWECGVAQHLLFLTSCGLKKPEKTTTVQSHLQASSSQEPFSCMHEAEKRSIIDDTSPLREETEIKSVSSAAAREHKVDINQVSLFTF